jgi:DNA-binding transcriptional ArsR family regulator
MPLKCEPPTTGRDRIAAWAKAMKFTPDLDERAALLALLGHPTRLRLFYALAELGEVCVCDLAEILGVTQSAVSQHLAKFRAYRLVSTRREAQTFYYSLASSPEVVLLRKAALEGIEAQL